VPIIFLIVGGGWLEIYASTLADIQQKQQQLDNGIVMCGDQQMHSGQTCEKYWQYGTPTSSLPGIDEGGNSYDAQLAENQLDLDKEKSSLGTNLSIGLLFTALGLLSLYGVIRIRQQHERAKAS